MAFIVILKQQNRGLVLKDSRSIHIKAQKEKRSENTEKNVRDAWDIMKGSATEQSI